jgi:hypothetical protein
MTLHGGRELLDPEVRQITRLSKRHVFHVTSGFAQLISVDADELAIGLLTSCVGAA